MCRNLPIRLAFKVGLEMRWLLTTIALAFPLAAVTSANAAPNTTPLEGDPNVVVRYLNSPSLPNEIAFRQFLALIQAGPADAEPVDLRIVARAVGIAPDEAGSYESARPYAEMFQEIRDLTAHDVVSEKYEILCTPDRVSKSDAALTDALTNAEDRDDSVHKRYYELTMARLSANERAIFQSFLDKVKLGTSYVRMQNQMGGMSRQVEAEKYCSELGHKLEVMGGSQ